MVNSPSIRIGPLLSDVILVAITRMVARAYCFGAGFGWSLDLSSTTSPKWIVDLPRSVYYNHSGYADVIITGLVGLRPRADNVVDIRPLAPAAWDYFCLQDVPYHGHLLTIFYDKTGQRYHRGIGLHVLSDGREFIHADTLQNVSGTIPQG